ncbi:MAG: hypothetical protein QXJ75_06020 [Candidatus Bathyarchaeia archaeon]
MKGVVILKAESEEVSSKFKNTCPLCRNIVSFAVEKDGVFAPARFGCGKCGAIWEYWEDWERRAAMRGAKLVEAGGSGRGKELLGAYLEAAFWQKLLEDDGVIDMSQQSIPQIGDIKVKYKSQSLSWMRLKRRLKFGKATPAERSSETPATIRYSMYNLEVYVPPGCRVVGERPNLKWEGRMDLQTPHGFKINIIWSPLVNVRDKYATPSAFVDAAIKEIEKKSDVKSLIVEERKTTELPGHAMDFCHFSVIHEQRKGFFGLRRRQAVGGCSAHMVAVIYCEEGLRYFIIYAETELEGSEKLGETFNQVLQYFKCHLSA